MFAAGLRRPEAPYYIKATEGLDSLRKDFDIGAKADIAQNLRFTPEVGSVTKRSAVSYYNSVEESNLITSVYRYYRESNNTAYIIQLNGTTLRASTTGTFSTIATLSGSSGKRFTAVTYKDLCFVSTGYDNVIVTDGTIGWELGGCKTELVTDAGGLVTAGAHYYAIVYTLPDGDIINGAHSNTVTTDAAHTKISLTNIPLGPSTCTARKLYRTAANGSTLKLLATLNTTDTTYTDNIADASLGADMSAVNNDVPKGLFLYVEQERLFIAGEVTRRSYVYYSEQYLPHYIPTGSADLSTTLPTSNYEPIAPDDGDVITGMVNVLGMTFVFKQNSIRNWHVSGTDDTWELSSIISKVGCPAPYSIANSPEGVYYQGWEHMYLFNGQYSIPVIDDFLFDENFLDSRRFDNVGYYWNNLYLLAYTDANSGHSYNDRVLVFDWIRKQTSIDRGGPITGGFMNVNCFASFRGSGEWGQLYAGDSQRGWVYQYDRSISSNQLNTISGFNAGTHSGSQASGTEDSPILSSIKLDDMSSYSTDALARAGWVSSVTTASYKVPPGLGTGSDGIKTVSSDETLAGGTYNYTSLTIDSGKTLTVPNGTVIKVMGPVTITGTLKMVTDGAGYLYAQTVTLTGTLDGNCSIRANTITNSGTITGISLGKVTPTSYSQYQAGGNLSKNATATTSFSSKTVVKVTYNISASATTDTYSSAPNASAYGAISLYYGGVWNIIASQSDSHNPGTSASISLNTSTTGAWSGVTQVKAYISSSCGADHDVSVNGAISSVEAFGSPSFDYINGTGTLPTSGDTTDFVSPLDVFSETTTVNEGTYSLKIVCCPTNTLNGYIEKTITATNLTSYNTILVDVWALRTGTNIQFGMGNSAYDSTLKNIVVATGSTWVTYQLDFTGATKNAITKLGFKFTNTDSGNLVFVDNIRPAITSCSYLSPRYEVNAQTLDKLYWNEFLTDYGDINFYTRTSDSSTDFTSWTDDTGWSAALTDPNGSTIVSSAKKYIQFKVAMTTSDTTGINFPYIYKATGYNIKFTYWKVRTTAETAVEFRYRTGWRNFDSPFDDKIYRKLMSYHEGTAGYFDVILEAGRQDTQTRTFSSNSLVTYPNRWYTTLPDNMYGKELRAEWYKNDNEDFKLRQFAIMLEVIPLI